MLSGIRPIVQIDTEFDSFNCLIDTGANISVFTLGYEMLKLYFPNAKLVSKNSIKLSGFGKGETEADLYCIDKITIKSDIDADYIELREVYAACCFRKDLGAALVLSYGMFDLMDITFMRDLGGCRELRIKHDLNVYYGNYRKDKGGNFVKRTSAFIQ